ncbi:ras and EF-hand domain-containing protein homolog [Folsomia candida]|uniref:Ras and EF-hand domain-containing protein n=1 Tax=Folsomia candida TaxID=158441 RepID=A0A226ES69_FOLCA|nr:ras and EF-hand domain-containing protein homolog [Folsomia candida]OXA60068.1 Ras and EF-hand domain-containing protein [Folsomia candida]
MMETRLEELFQLCDPTGVGHIGREELRSLCATLRISLSDADAIFLDLDNDGDGSITFSEFSHGFRDFLNPGTRRGSFQTPTPSEEQLNEMGRKHASARGAWSNFSTTLGIVPESECLGIPEESVSKSLSLLMADVTRLTDDYRSLENSFRRSAQVHAAQLEALGEEMEYVKTEARTKQEAREEAAKQVDAERRKIAGEMETQLAELSEQLLCFKKAWMSNEESKNRGCVAGNNNNGLESENKTLRSSLLEAQTKAAVLQSQLVLKRNDYLELCEELKSEKAVHRNAVEAMQDHLSSLNEANRVLCDANDCLVTSATGSGPSSYAESHLGDKDSGRGTLMDEFRTSEEINSPGYSSSLWSKTIISEPPPQLERTFKVILAGDAAVGKSTFIERVCQGHFTPNLSSTIGVDFRVKSVEVDGVAAACQIWDTAGQERFRSLTKSYFRRADGVLLLYDVTSERTFLSIRHWVHSIQEGAGRSLPIILCGNKSDLRNREGVACVPWEEGSKLAASCGASFLETSPKSGENVMNSLVLLVREMSAIEDTELKNSVTLLESVPSKKGCCSSS